MREVSFIAILRFSWLADADDTNTCGTCPTRGHVDPRHPWGDNDRRRPEKVNAIPWRPASTRQRLPPNGPQPFIPPARSIRTSHGCGRNRRGIL